MKDFYTTIQEWAPIEEMTAPASTKEKQEAAVDAVSKKKEEITNNKSHEISIDSMIDGLRTSIDKYRPFKTFLKQKKQSIKMLTVKEKAAIINSLIDDEYLD
jgi:hypothetical protein